MSVFSVRNDLTRCKFHQYHRQYCYSNLCLTCWVLHQKYGFVTAMIITYNYFLHGASFRVDLKVLIVQSVAYFHSGIRCCPLAVGHIHVLNCFFSLSSTTLAPNSTEWLDWPPLPIYRSYRSMVAHGPGFILVWLIQLWFSASVSLSCQQSTAMTSTSSQSIKWPGQIFTFVLCVSLYHMEARDRKLDIKKWGASKVAVS
jgi:hypothetical protein